MERIRGRLHRFAHEGLVGSVGENRLWARWYEPRPPEGRKIGRRERTFRLWKCLAAANRGTEDLCCGRGTVGFRRLQGGSGC